MPLKTQRIHVQTLVEMNHCVGIARRDAAYQCLVSFALKGLWQQSSQKRAHAYEFCLMLIQDALTTTEKASHMCRESKLGLWNKPVLHFLRLLLKLIQTLVALASHASVVKEEAEVLADHLDQDTYAMLSSTCHDFESNEQIVLQAFMRTLAVGQALINGSSEKSQAIFSPDETRRYQLAFAEYTSHYTTAQNEAG